MRTLNSLDGARRYFLGLCDDLIPYTENGSALVFVPACSVLEYLGKLAAGKDRGRDGFIDYVTTWLSQARPEYASFTYASGTQDFPLQLYHVLRCGIVHSFSLLPDKRARTNGGRDRSVVLGHREAVAREGVQHLGHYSTPDIADAAVLIAEDFVSDIRSSATLLFDAAASDARLAAGMLSWLNQHPPIRGGF